MAIDLVVLVTFERVIRGMLCTESALSPQQLPGLRPQLRRSCVSATVFV